MVVLETSFLIDLLKDNEKAAQIVKKLDRLDEEKCAASVTAMELYFGVLQSGKEEKIMKLISLLRSLIILDFDYASAIEASRIKNDLTKKGLIIELEDIMIAGIAKINKQKLITRNAKHFERIGGLEVETY